MASQLRHFFRLVRQCMGLMTSQLRHFRARSILWAFVVPKLMLYLLKQAGVPNLFQLTLILTNFFQPRTFPWDQLGSSTSHPHSSTGKNSSFGKKKFGPFHSLPCSVIACCGGLVVIAAASRPRDRWFKAIYFKLFFTGTCQSNLVSVNAFRP